MKKVIFILLCLSLTSCAYHARTSVWLKGNELQGKYQLINTINGKGIRGLVLRETLLTIDTKGRLPEVPKVSLSEEDENKGDFEVK